jgi:hypothetical protein
MLPNEERETGGKTANDKGKSKEHEVAEALRDLGFQEQDIKSKDKEELYRTASNSYREGKYSQSTYIKNYPYQSPAKKYSKAPWRNLNRTEFYLPREDARIEVKSQEVSGSKDEAIYGILHMLEKGIFPERNFILLMLGNGFKDGLKEYVEKEIMGRAGVHMATTIEEFKQIVKGLQYV